MMEEKFTYAEKAKPDIRELTMMNGISYPSDEELLMLILNRGTRESPVEKLAKKVLGVMNGCGVDGLIEKLVAINGIGEAKALAVAAALELGRRRSGFLKTVIERPSDIVPFVKPYALESTEHFVCVSVNGAHELMGIRVISVGTTNRTIIHPREVFAKPIEEHAAGIICCHNHPFGACYPSKADRDTTDLLKKGASVLGITFLDHIIITRNEYFSFLEHGMI